MTTPLAHFLSRHCRLLTILTLLSLIIPLSQMPKARVNNSVEMWLSSEQPTFKSYSKFLKRYGSEQFIVLATQWPDPLADDALEQQVKLAQNIQQIPAVQSTFDFGTIARRIEQSQIPFTELINSVLSSLQIQESSKTSSDRQLTTQKEKNTSTPTTSPSGTASVKSGEVTEVTTASYLKVIDAMIALDISIKDIITIPQNISKAYSAFTNESSACVKRIAAANFLSAMNWPPITSYSLTATTIGLGLYGELASSYRTLSEEFTQLHIDQYAQFIGIARPDWRTFIRTDPLFKNFLIGPDGRTVGMLITLNNSQPLSKTVDALYATIAESGIPENRVFLAGTPVINIELDRGSRSVSARFLPLAVGLGSIVLIVIIRNLVGCIAISITLTSSMLWTIGLLFMTGRTLNMVTITLPALLISLALAGNIHMVTHYLALLTNGQSPRDALNKTVKTMLFPVFMTSLTTAVGFASVMISDIRPIQDFGLFAAIGILISGLFNFILLPGILSFNHTAPKAAHYNRQHWTHKFIAFLPYPRPIITVAIAMLIVGTSLTFKTHASSDTVSFLPTNSRITRDYYAIMNNLTGLYSLEIDITSPPDHRGETIAAMNTIAQAYDENPLVAKTLYIGQFKHFIARLGLPALLAFNQDTNKDQFISMLNRYQSADENGFHWRMSVLARAQGSRQFQQLQTDIESQLKTNLPAQTTYSVTGLVPLLNASQKAIVYTQIRSFSIAVFVILALIGLFMGSFRALLAAILPNALPIVTMFSFMALANIPLDTATVMIAGIATGIAADDTIHFLSCYRLNRPNFKTPQETFIATFDQTGRSITWTSITAASGFAILLFAPFKPLQYFGLLGTLTMLTAWLCDVIILPATIKTLNLWSPKK